MASEIRKLRTSDLLVGRERLGVKTDAELCALCWHT